MKCFLRVMAVVAGGAVFSASASAQSIYTAHVKPQCLESYADPVRIKLNGTEFRIPNFFKADFYNEYGKPEAPKRRTTCNGQTGILQEPNTPPFEVDQVSIQKEASRLPNSYQTNPAAPYSSFSQIDFMIGGSLVKSPIKFFCHEKSEAEKNIKKWIYSNEISGFYKGINKLEDGNEYYYSVVHKIYGIPVVVHCGQDANSKRADSVYLGGLCQISNSAIGSLNSISIRFNKNELPPAMWASAIKEINQFLHQSIVNGQALPTFQSCKNPAVSGEK